MKEIFSYEIDGIKVKVIHSNIRILLINDNIFNGFKAAVSEYLCYPYHIIAPRIDKHCKITFEYDKDKLQLFDAQLIFETTKKAVLNFLLCKAEAKEQLIDSHILKPSIGKDKLDKWIERIKIDASKIDTFFKITKDDDMDWIEFDYVGPDFTKNKFYAKYKKMVESKALLVSLPGYQAEWNDLTAYYNTQYDVLQLSPLGYNTPKGYDKSKLENGAWPVLYDTVLKDDFYTGYTKWFFECIIAINAIRKESQKIIFIGTSQGGGAALVLASIFNDITLGCAAEMPFLIGFSGKNYDKVCSFVSENIGKQETIIYRFNAQERLFYIDPINHVDRIKACVLLISGEYDTDCPAEDIYELYNKLTGIKEYYNLKDAGHGYTKEFSEKAVEWLQELKDEQ